MEKPFHLLKKTLLQLTRYISQIPVGYWMLAIPTMLAFCLFFFIEVFRWLTKLIIVAYWLPLPGAPLDTRPTDLDVASRLALTVAKKADCNYFRPNNSTLDESDYVFLCEKEGNEFAIQIFGSEKGRKEGGMFASESTFDRVVSEEERCYVNGLYYNVFLNNGGIAAKAEQIIRFPGTLHCVNGQKHN